MQTIDQFLDRGMFERSLNASFSITIPKQERTTNNGDYRHISLVGSINKMLFKVLSKRLKKVTKETVSSSQKTCGS